MFYISICIFRLFYISFRFFYKSGNYCIGGFRKHKPHGKGEYEWVNGDRVIVCFVDGKDEGKVKYYSKDGEEIDILFKDGEIVREANTEEKDTEVDE